MPVKSIIDLGRRKSPGLGRSRLYNGSEDFVQEMPETLDQHTMSDATEGEYAAPTLPTSAGPLTPPKQAKAVRLSYWRWLRLSRLAMVAYLAMAVVSTAWLLPWLPGGLNTDDYTSELGFTIYLLSSVAVIGILAAASRELAGRHRETLIMWASVYEEESGLHNRSYLYDRLSLECEQAERNSAVFSILVLRFRVTSSVSGNRPVLPHSTFEGATQIINRLTRPADLVARLSDNELAILATTVDEKGRKRLLERIVAAVTDEFSELFGEADDFEVASGCSTFGVDGTQAEALVSTARGAVPLSPRRDLFAA